MLAAMHARGVEFCTLTHAAGISSTGDAELDRQLPFDEPYHIPDSTVAAIRRAGIVGGRIVAIGTTVVRALEHAAAAGGRVRSGEALANQRIGSTSRLRVVDVILSGTHEPGTSHFELLRAFADDEVLGRANQTLEALGFRTHEFGDSVLIEKSVNARPDSERAGESLLDTGSGHKLPIGRIAKRFSAFSAFSNQP